MSFHSDRKRGYDDDDDFDGYAYYMSPREAQEKENKEFTEELGSALKKFKLNYEVESPDNYEEIYSKRSDTPLAQRKEKKAEAKRIFSLPSHWRPPKPVVEERKPYDPTNIQKIIEQTKILQEEIERKKEEKENREKDRNFTDDFEDLKGKNLTADFNSLGGTKRRKTRRRKTRSRKTRSRTRRNKSKKTRTRRMKKIKRRN
jgi:hypothetical protein